MIIWRTVGRENLPWSSRICVAVTHDSTTPFLGLGQGWQHLGLGRVAWCYGTCPLRLGEAAGTRSVLCRVA
jgi:hypothetical protein